MMLKAVLVALALLPRFHEDREAVGKVVQENAIAAAIAKVTSNPDEAAFLLAWGDAETHYSLRIHEGRCFRWECDRGRARGPWQLHRNGRSLELWDRMHGVDNVDVQAREALKMARWAMNECRMKGDERILSGFRMLGAKGCHGVLPGERDRLAAFKRVRASL
jgi:hypothetical protein